VRALLGYGSVAAMLECRVGDRDGGEQPSGGTAGAELMAVAVSGVTVTVTASPNTTTVGRMCSM
jgi:hypothetical protein